MISLTSSAIANFLVDYKLTGCLCTIKVDLHKLTATVLVEADTVKYLVRIHQLEHVYASDKDVASFSFYIPDAVKLMTDKSTIKFHCSGDSRIMQVNCTAPNFSFMVETVDLEIEEFSTDYQFKEYPALKQVSGAIKASKGLASELMVAVTVELTDGLWCVHTNQSCAFGEFEGLQGTIPVNIFEKLYNSSLRIGMTQPSPTSLMSKIRYKNRDIHILAPIQNEFSLSKSITKLIDRCEKKICDSVMSEDIISLVSGFIANVKKKTLAVSFSTGRVDLTYKDTKFTLSTLDTTSQERPITVQVPVKALLLIKSITEEECEVYTDMEVLCLMNKTRGLILSGPVY